MKLFSHKKFSRVMRIGILLLFVAGIALALSVNSFMSVSMARPSAEGMYAAALAFLTTMSIMAVLAVFIVAFAASALLRREVLHSRHTEITLSQYRRAAEESSDLIAVLETSGRIEFINPALERATGYGKDDLIGRKITRTGFWYGNAELGRQMRETVLAGNDSVRRIEGRTRDGALLVLEERVLPYRDARGRVSRIISTARDMTRERKLEDRIEDLNRYDQLTGLPNRSTLLAHLEQRVASAGTGGALVSVLLLDIDRFKYVNDLCGSEAGDAVLNEMSRRIKAAVDPADFVARTGSDEFAVVHTDAAKPLLADAVAQKIRAALAPPVAAGGQELALTVCTGAAVYPDDGTDAWSLLKNADLALAHARAQGRNAIQFFARGISDRVKEFFVLEKRLFTALKNNEYLLHYQPYCDLLTRKVAGAEALIRWNNSDLGVVSPARFIPSLEDTGKVVEVGRWILATACNQIKEWDRQDRRFPVSVNLSLVQFRNQHLVATVKDVIADFRIDPGRLTLEVTESVFIHDMDFAITTLNKLKDVGVMLSVDDFGTGYSSLSYIKRLPVDSLKIDISFVRDVARDQDSASIVSAITTLARSLNLKTIAEGVETEEQRSVLHLLRCDMGQGYLFSPAVDAGEFGKLLV